MRFLSRFNIRVIIFPAHCTHVLQPFDVGVSSPLKSKYEAKFIEFMLEFQKSNNRNPSAAEMRSIRVYAFMAAWTGLSFDIMRKSFVSSGICPFEKENLAMERLITNADVARMIQTGHRQHTSILNNNEATKPEILAQLNPYYAAAVNHGFFGPPFPLDFTQLNAGDIITAQEILRMGKCFLVSQQSS